MEKTMTLRPIIRASGLDPTKYYRANFFHINLFDDDGQVITDENIAFEKPLFEKNSDELKRFENLLNRLDDTIPSFIMDVQIKKDSVIVFFRTSKPEIFFRTPV